MQLPEASVQLYRALVQLHLAPVQLLVAASAQVHVLSPPTSVRLHCVLQALLLRQQLKVPQGYIPPGIQAALLPME
jgi:hypothetical protein